MYEDRIDLVKAIVFLCADLFSGCKGCSFGGKGLFQISVRLGFRQLVAEADSGNSNWHLRFAARN